MRTPPLKKLPTNVFFRWADVAPGKFGCWLWAPNRPPREQRSAALSGGGAVPTSTGLVSVRISTTQISLGASPQVFLTASSDTIARLRSNSGCTVWVQAGNGGE